MSHIIVDKVRMLARAVRKATDAATNLYRVLETFLPFALPAICGKLRSSNEEID